MEVHRTAPVKLVVSDEQCDALHDTRDQFLWCANRASEVCWSKYDYEECITNKCTAQAALYDELRENTDLTASLVIGAIYRAVEAVKGCVERWKKRQRVSQPEFTSWFMDFDKRASTIRRNEVSLSTVDGRVECDFVLPSDSPTPYERYVLAEDYEFRTSTLHRDEATDEFYFHITTRTYDDKADGSTDSEHQTVLGIDRGVHKTEDLVSQPETQCVSGDVNSLAVASTGTFWQGDDYDHWIREFEKRRASMNQRGGQAAHNALFRLGKRERAWRTQYIHTVANDIVTEALETDCSTSVFEKFDGIRECLSGAEWHHLWAFRRLYKYVAYKAPERGVSVEQVTPNHTSQRCSKCGFTHEDNRDSTAFDCLSCGYTVNADYNAVARLHLAARKNAYVLATAKNIGLRYARNEYHRLRSSQMSSDGDVFTNRQFVACH